MQIIGAHLVGLAARKVTSGTVNSIIGLDPASLGFSIHNDRNRLAKTDADYVQIIHTNTKAYGMNEAIGHGIQSTFTNIQAINM